MADHFLTKSQIDFDQCLPWGGGLALDAYAALHAAISARLSPEVAALFAEPLISRGNDAAPASVSWYVEHGGEGRPLSELDDAEQARVATTLGRHLTALRGLLADSEDGLLIGAALHLAGSSRGDIWVVNGQPVLINWGMLPPGLPRDARARAEHFGRTLGRFVALSAAPPLTEDERRQRAGRQAGPSTPDRPDRTVPPGGAEPTATAPTATAPTATAPVTAPPPAPRSRAIRRSDVVPLLALLLLSAAALLWLMWPGNRLFPPVAADAVDDIRAAGIVAEINASLEARRAALQAALDGAQCHADGTLLMPDGRSIEGLLPPGPGDAPGRRAAADPTPILPPDPNRVQIGGASGTAPDGTDQDTGASLLDVIESRTVMVIARKNGSVSTGSGFFIAPDLVVTNFHVVTGAPPDQIFVTNRSLGRVRGATVLYSEGPFSQTSTDFALLRVPGVEAPHFMVHDPAGSLKLQSVIAAGYPGDVMASDVAYGALLAGDASAAPDLTVTDGTVSTEQQLAPGASAVVHSAPISQGNSGGPLIDMCGRVIGVNTFVRQGTLRTLNFALSAPTVLGFLRKAGVSADVTTAPCQPQILRPSIARAPEAATAGTAPQTGTPQTGTPQTGTPQTGTPQTGTVPTLPDFGAPPPSGE